MFRHFQTLLGDGVLPRITTTFTPLLSLTLLSLLSILLILILFLLFLSVVVMVTRLRGELANEGGDEVGDGLVASVVQTFENGEEERGVADAVVLIFWNGGCAAAVVIL